MSCPSGGFDHSVLCLPAAYPPPPSPPPRPPPFVRPVIDGEHISRLAFVTGSNPCPDKSYDKLPTDIDFGTDGPAIFMCLLSSTVPPYLISLQVVTGKSDQVSCPAGTESSIDLNSGASSGNTVYACMNYSTAWTPVRLKDVLIIVGQSSSCPISGNYYRLAGNLNSGILSAPDLYLCANGEFGLLSCYGRLGYYHSEDWR